MLVLVAFIVTGGVYLFSKEPIAKAGALFGDRVGAIAVTQYSIDTKNHNPGESIFEIGSFAFVNLTGSYLDGKDEILSEALSNVAPVTFFCFNSSMAILVSETSTSYKFIAIPANYVFDLLSNKPLNNQNGSFIMEKYMSMPSVNNLEDIYVKLSELASVVPEMSLPSSDSEAETMTEKDIKESSTVKIPTIIFTESSFTNFATLAVVGGTFFSMFFQMLMLYLICIAFFPLAEYFRMTPLRGKISYKAIVIVTMYCTFPALLIGGLFTAAGVTFMTFPMVFMISFFIYELIGFNGIIRHFMPPPPQDEFDDDDF